MQVIERKSSKHLINNNIEFEDETFNTCLIAIQGPNTENL